MAIYMVYVPVSYLFTLYMIGVEHWNKSPESIETTGSIGVPDFCSRRMKTGTGTENLCSSLLWEIGTGTKKGHSQSCK
jgi:hypothetical protein